MLHANVRHTRILCSKLYIPIPESHEENSVILFVNFDHSYAVMFDIWVLSKLQSRTNNKTHLNLRQQILIIITSKSLVVLSSQSKYI